MIVLCADDYAMTDGVARGIEKLAEARRISATSALVTMPGWHEAAPRLVRHRDQLAIGLHLDLTLGTPLTSVPTLAPDRRFPDLGRMIKNALARRLNRDEVRREITAQLDDFERHLGHPPDHVDGHQHVHVLPVVRGALIDELARRYPRIKPLLRDPSDRLAAIVARRAARTKALAVGTLSLGFARAAKQAGFVTNDGFSGFSRFDERHSYGPELERCLHHTSRLHIVMCHPGIVDAGLADLDPVVARRRQELDALAAAPGLPERIWHPHRAVDGPPVDWAGVPA